MKISIITNTFNKYHRQDIAYQSWVHIQKQFPNNIELYNFQFKNDSDIVDQYYNEMKIMKVLERSSQDYIVGSSKKIPLIYDFIDKGFSEIDCDYVVYTNSDVMLLPRLIEYILHNKPDCMAGSRLDIEDIDSFQKVLDNSIKIVRHEIAGYDFFVFERNWFMEFRMHFDNTFLIGKPLFDVVFAGLMVMFGRNFHIANDFPVMALHIHHGLAAVTTECDEKNHNISIFNDNILYRIADNIMFHNLQHNLCRRTPWGSFVNIQADEKIIQDNFFKDMNIHSVNNISFKP